jgi:protein-S-isoprenylcysteine O-methyltransferase Ste14
VLYGRGYKKISCTEGKSWENPEKKSKHRLYSRFKVLSYFLEAGTCYDAVNRDPLPNPIYGMGDIMMILSMILVAWVLRENSFASKVVNNQDGEVLITTGPYTLVRHPFFTFLIPFLLGLPLVIGSYWSLIPGLSCIPTLIWRAYHEEKFLVQEFDTGYKQYQHQVPSRMFPGLF